MTAISLKFQQNHPLQICIEYLFNTHKNYLIIEIWVKYIEIQV